MTILYPTTALVKTRRFGAGILPSVPSYQADHTASDEAWYVSDSISRRALDAEVDALFAESEAIRLVELGLN
jgi:hypothetical protein